jgi:DNA-binding GntR family transcriptional regulator
MKEIWRTPMRETLLWEKVAKRIAGRIASGKWGVGTVLPGEIELAKEFDVSRDTMRRALNELVKSGLIERRKHAGTRVLSHGNSVGFLHEITSLRGIDEYGNQYERYVLESGLVSVVGEEADLLGVPAGSMMLKLENVRVDHADRDQPVVATNVYLWPQDQEAVERMRRRPGELAVSCVEKVRGVQCSEVRQTITAVRPPEEVAERLRISADEPALRVVRHYMADSATPLVISVSHHPGGLYSFRFNVKRATMKSQF